MKKAIAMLLAAAMLTVVFAGCTPKPAEVEPTAVPTTEVPATDEPATAVPASQVPATDAPSTEKPTASDETQAPETDVPATDVPATQTPGTDEPATQVPATDAPATQAPATDVPATAVPTSVPTPTQAPTEEPQTGPKSATRVTFNAKDITKYFTGGNAVKAEAVDDAEYGRAAKLSTTQSTNDPFITFNYESYVKAYGLQPASADEYKIVVLKIKQDKCSNTQSEIFYCAGSIYGAQGGYSKTSTFDNTDPDWQYVVFNLSSSNGWTKTIHAFRFDYMFTAASAGESITVGELILLRSMDELSAIFDSSATGDRHALSEADQKRAEQLINSAKDTAPAISNTKLTAPNEDSDISLWFNHSYVKTPEESTEPSGMNAYQLRIARNEIEGVQFLLASTKAKTGLTAELSDIVDGSGNKLKYVICEGYYFADVEGQTIVDPIPELKNKFDLKANKSKTFLIKVYTDTDTKAGQYSAVLTIRDSAGREIKKANLYVYVWNFALPLASNCKIQADLSWWNIYCANPPWTYAGDDGVGYARYYEFLLENKVNAYNLPYLDASDGSTNPFPDSKIDKYLNDPRVQCFNPVGFGTKNVTEARIQNAYKYLSKNPEWLAKAYFYPIDEPKDKGELDSIIYYGNMIKNVFGSQYKLIAPMHINYALDSSSTVDFFKYVDSVVNIWCPKTYFFNSLADYKANPTLMFQYYTAMLEKNLGTFAERMATEQAGGDEVWWYVTRFPHHPEITLSISDPEIEHRLLFWQQKMYDVDGFLYYLVNDWWLDNIWNSKHEQNSAYPYNVYGNGVLVYNGFEDANGDPYISREHYDEVSDKSFYAYPVGSLRLESVRDGAEDYDYFTILDDLYGEGTSDLIIKQITTSLGNYKTDNELLNTLRIAVGNLIAAKQ